MNQLKNYCLKNRNKIQFYVALYYFGEKNEKLQIKKIFNSKFANLKELN